jgi:hypothetical protein
LCQEDAQASCCTKDEGGPFGATLQGEASNSHELLSVKSCGGGRHGKRRDIRSRHVGIRETNANEPPITHRNTTRTTSEPELPARAGRSTEATYSLAVRCPVSRGRDSSLGFRTELENLVCDGKGKGTSGSPVRPKVPMRKPGADCSVGALIRGNARGAKGAGHPY